MADKTKTLADRLSAMRACQEAVEWARGYTDAAVAWRECQRGDWMLWLLGRVHVDLKRLVLAACECARLSLHLVPAGEDRPRIAIETAESWAHDAGKTIVDVRRAATAAYAAATAAYAADAAADDAAYAADAAAYAAYAVADRHDAAYAVDAAAYAAYAANAAAANAAAAYAVYAVYAADAAYADAADIVRKHFPEAPHVQ